MASAAWDLISLARDDRRQVEAWLRDFTWAWHADGLAKGVLALPASGNPLRLPALLGLVQIDLRLQWQNGRRVTVEAYLRQFPELGTPDTVPISLIHGEYEARTRAGALHDLPHFARRFPRRTAELEAFMQAAVALAAAADGTIEPRPSTQPPAPASGMATISMQLGRYRVVKLLGQGGMGAVYLAFDVQLERQVALKVPHITPADGPDALKRFDREARAAATLNHPNLCQVYDFGTQDGVPFLTMAFIEGQTLAERLRREGPLAPREAASIVRTIALALHEAHALGIIHRDLKPSNVMLNHRGAPVVMDFGLARQANRPNAGLTQKGAMMGTPAYMPPEQVRGDASTMGPGCDIYSLGVILYELLTARVPFDGPPALVPGQVLTQVSAPPSTHRPGLDPRLDAICLRAMQKEVVSRYANMPEFAAALNDYLAAPAVPVATIAPPRNATATPPHPQARRIGVAIILGALAVVVVCLGVVGLLTAALWGMRAQSSAREPAAPVRIAADPAAPPTGVDVNDKAVPLKDRPGPVAAPKIAAPEKTSVLDLGGGITLKMVRVDSGTFLMGSPLEEVGRQPDEFQHTVEITRPFYIGVYVVTQTQYRQVMGTNPSSFSATGGDSRAVGGTNTDGFPVEQVSWDEAMAFCTKVSERPGVKGRGRVDLPTEAQWEYACRAGTKTAFHYGNSLSSTQANFNGQYPYGVAARGVYLGRTAKVGSYLPNAWGLFDMHGNVYQWCKDGYEKDYYGNCPRADPCNETNAGFRVLRGGSWYDDAEYCRSACRYGYAPGSHNNYPGFRVVLCLD